MGDYMHYEYEYEITKSIKELVIKNTLDLYHEHSINKLNNDVKPNDK